MSVLSSTHVSNNAASTPRNDADQEEDLIIPRYFFDPDLSPVLRPSDITEAGTFKYFATVQNKPVSPLDPVTEENSTFEDANPPDNYIDRPLKCLKYVDDCLSLEKMSFRNAMKISSNGRPIAIARAPKSQAFYRTVSRNASLRGMKLNAGKTRLLCISPPLSYVPDPFIDDSKDDRITAVKELKILGFHFNTEPNVKAHMAITQKKFLSRIWTLRHLRRNGFKPNELVRVYVSMVRPVAEYCSNIYGPLITCLLYTSPSPRD